MDKILMEGLAFYGYHGVLKEEKKLGQKFFIDITLFIDLKEAGKTDDLDYTVDYENIYKITKKIVENEQYNLLEALAERICEKVLHSFDIIQKIDIKIRKPGAPVAGIFDCFAVQIVRERKKFNE